MNRTTRENRLLKQRKYNEGSRERRVKAGRPLRSDVASAVLLAFLDSSVENGAAPSLTIVGHLVDAGFKKEQALVVISDLVERHRKQG